MSTEMVLLAWGKPNDIDQQEVTTKSSKERWVYGTPRKDAKYVWFKDDRVIKIKD